MGTSFLPFAAAIAGAIAMALAFPKVALPVLAPLGAVGVFWAWFGVAPMRAFWIGWAAGTAYFAISFSWFAESVGALVAPFGFVLVLLPALIDGFLGFALAGFLVASLARRSSSAYMPAAAAAAFACTEWFRAEGIGELAVPFANLGYSQVATPLAAFAPFVGTYGITFAVCVIGAYGARALRTGVAGPTLVAWVATAGLAGLALAGRPTRYLPAPTFRVAAIQGNIAQSVKFRPEAFPKAVDRYTALTLRAAAFRPRLVVWPETVIPVELDRLPAVSARFGALARRIGATLVVGTLATAPKNGAYNALYVYGPSGALAHVYRKRLLVPFAEHLPYPWLFASLPWAHEVSHLEPGDGPGLFEAGGVRIAPAICWEADFSALVAGDVRAGAQTLAISTDDAWFGTTAGPYAHVEIARMRALETGRWVVRAASTGVSAIIEPGGRYQTSAPVGVMAIVTGRIGPPAPAPYPSYGPRAVVAALALIYLAGLALPRGARRPSSP